MSTGFDVSGTAVATSAATPTAQSRVSGFRADINALRAIAVVAVVLFHFGVPGITGGFVGVDVFFVISGYLMSQIIQGGIAAGRFSVTGFYMARVRRIVRRCSSW